MPEHQFRQVRGNEGINNVYSGSKEDNTNDILILFLVVLGALAIFAILRRKKGKIEPDKPKPKRTYKRKTHAQVIAEYEVEKEKKQKEKWSESHFK